MSVTDGIFVEVHREHPNIYERVILTLKTN